MSASSVVSRARWLRVALVLVLLFLLPSLVREEDMASGAAAASARDGAVLLLRRRRPPPSSAAAAARRPAAAAAAAAWASPPPLPPLLRAVDATSAPTVSPLPPASASRAPSLDGLDWPAACDGTPLRAALREYAAWREGKLVFLRAARGDVAAARRLQAAAGDADPPMTLAVYGALGGGWGDRVPAIVHLFLFAMRMRRVFFLHMPPVYRWMESPVLDWRVDAAALPALVQALAESPPLAAYTCEDIDLCPFSFEDPTRRWPAADPISPHLISNRGAWHPRMHASHRDWATALVGGLPACATQALLRPTATLRALPAVAAALAAFAAARAAGLVVAGFHHRAGDMAILHEAYNVSFLPLANATTPAAAAALLEETMADWAGYGLAREAAKPGQVLFFVTDARDVRAAARTAFPGILTTDTRPLHVGNDASDLVVGGIRDMVRAADNHPDDVAVMRDTLVDWWLLANVDVQVGYINSGFARSAVVASSSGRWKLNEVLDCKAGNCCIGVLQTQMQCFTTGSAI